MTPTARVWTYLTVGVAGAALGVWLVILWLPGWLVTARPTSTPTATPVAQVGQVAPVEPMETPASGAPTDSRRISATLFYVAPSGDALIPVEINVPYAAAPAEQARRIVERQLAAAPGGRTSAIPAGTTLRALFLTSRGEAFVDVSRDIVTRHPGGSLSESLTVYAIVNALTVNLPDITAVQLLVDGREVDTLVGHLDLRRPLGRATRWVRRTP
ncbi:MAG: GerMN domain-containing protein [Acidobacteria bacterium]|nr:GerMN domain-containing protein [Acidobacteriota bacterium]